MQMDQIEQAADARSAAWKGLGSCCRSRPGLHMERGIQASQLHRDLQHEIVPDEEVRALASKLLRHNTRPGPVPLGPAFLDSFL